MSNKSINNKKTTNEETKKYKKNEKIYRNSKMLEEDTSIEDSTKYGEFISSYFDWITLDEQKKRACELDKMTKNAENSK